MQKVFRLSHDIQVAKQKQRYLELMFARLGRRGWIEKVDGENLFIVSKNVEASQFPPHMGV